LIVALYVTHDQSEALTLGDRIVIMEKGRIVQVGTPEDMYERPAEAFVADFIGTSSFFPGRVHAADGGDAVVRLTGGTTLRALPKVLSTWCRRGKAAAGAAVTRVHVSPREQHQSHRAR
jgi:ABC-type Fe3+/spermidine/putrescine transport system ATPase subunit